MLDFENLVGLDSKQAAEILHENGYKDIEIVINSNKNLLCDSLLVAKVKKNGGKVVLVCGEFYLDIKG